MIAHIPWRGDAYAAGIEGQKLAIVGHSHWLGPDGEDDEDVTRSCLAKIISGEWRIAFFTKIKNYFGIEEHSDFWHRVLFFNYLPDCIGFGEQRYGCGTPEQIVRAQARFLALLREHRPEKVLIFSNSEGKGWRTCPPTCEEMNGTDCARLGEDFPPAFTWGTYDAGGYTVSAFGLRHPQTANSAVMKRAVRGILAR
jgi:hypothetical protein